MEKENIRPIDIKDFKDSQHTLDYIDNDFAIVNSLEGIPDNMILSDWNVSSSPSV